MKVRIKEISPWFGLEGNVNEIEFTNGLKVYVKDENVIKKVEALGVLSNDKDTVYDITYAQDEELNFILKGIGY